MSLFGCFSSICLLIRISLGACGRFSPAELVAFSLSVSIVCVWVLTGHWLLMDAMGMGLCVAFIAFVRLPSLKVSTLLLTGLLIYDVFWVFFSSYIFSSNVMVRVATKTADNPVGIVARRLNLGGATARDAPKLSLPGKLVFPSMQNTGHFSMLGLGDIVMPGLLLCFVLRYDAYKRAQLNSAEAGVPPPKHLNRITYFHCSLIGYFLGKIVLNFVFDYKIIKFYFLRLTDCHRLVGSVQSSPACFALSGPIHIAASFDNGLHQGET